MAGGDMCGGGCAWQGGACVAGGMHGRGVCMAGEACVGGRAVHGGEECMSRDMHAMHAPWQILRDTVNERAVRILLECILVGKYKHFK